MTNHTPAPGRFSRGRPFRIISCATVGSADSPAAPKPQGRDTLAPLRLAADLLLAKGYRWDNGQWREPAGRIEAAMEPLVTGPIAICPTCGAQTAGWVLNAQAKE